MLCSQGIAASMKQKVNRDKEKFKLWEGCLFVPCFLLLCRQHSAGGSQAALRPVANIYHHHKVLIVTVVVLALSVPDDDSTNNGKGLKLPTEATGNNTEVCFRSGSVNKYKLVFSFLCSLNFAVE